LTDEELDRLVDFLNTLTDESFKPKVPVSLPSGMPAVHNDVARNGDITYDGAANDE
jgi:cytochrome c peroxidase